MQLVLMRVCLGLVLVLQQQWRLKPRDFEIGIGTEVGFAHWREVENAFPVCVLGL